MSFGFGPSDLYALQQTDRSPRSNRRTHDRIDLSGQMDPLRRTLGNIPQGTALRADQRPSHAVANPETRRRRMGGVPQDAAGGFFPAGYLPPKPRAEDIMGNDAGPLNPFARHHDVVKRKDIELHHKGRSRRRPWGDATDVSRSSRISADNKDEKKERSLPTAAFYEPPELSPDDVRDFPPWDAAETRNFMSDTFGTHTKGGDSEERTVFSRRWQTYKLQGKDVIQEEQDDDSSPASQLLLGFRGPGRSKRQRDRRRNLSASSDTFLVAATISQNDI